FSDNMTLTNSVRWGETRQDYQLSAFMSTSAIDVDGNPTGNIRWTDPDDLSSYTMVRGLNTFKDIENTIVTDQLNLRIDFSTAGIEHTLRTGLELTREDHTIYGIASTGSPPDGSLPNPGWQDTGGLSPSRTGANTRGKRD